MSYPHQPEVVAEARQIDLLTYLQNHEPEELVHISGNNYSTKTHDSLKISNGKWHWFSRGIGGRSALDYLIKVRGFSFLEAVERLSDTSRIKSPRHDHLEVKEKPRSLLLPKANANNNLVITYLQGRGIDRGIIQFCIETGRLYESTNFHNAVFVGFDAKGKERYACLRGTNASSFKGEANGSNKRFSFSIPAKTDSNSLHLFESAIDLLSYATLLVDLGHDWREQHLLSLAGVFYSKREATTARLPVALEQYLSDHPQISKVNLRLDNDAAGKQAATLINASLPKEIDVLIDLPVIGKDYNDLLCFEKGLPYQSSAVKNRRHMARK